MEMRESQEGMALKVFLDQKDLRVILLLLKRDGVYQVALAVNRVRKEKLVILEMLESMAWSDTEV